MSMPEYADIWETTDTVVMEKPGSLREDCDQPEPIDEQSAPGETELST